MRRTTTVMLLVGLIWTSATATEASAPTPARFTRWLEGPISALILPDEIEAAREIGGSGLEEEFIAWFWARRDPDAATPLNELRAEFADRLAFVDKEYLEPEHGLPGWGTPRGQIYLLMGAPSEVLSSSQRYRVEGSLRRLTVWHYGRRAGGRSVRFCFVETRSGIRLATDQKRRMQTDQTAALDAARSRLVVRTAGGRFGESGDYDDESLPLDVSIAERDEGWLAAIRLPLHELLGEPDGEAIRYRLAIAARSGHGTGTQREYQLGALEIRLSASDFRTWSDQQIHIAVWAPTGVTTLQITETPTGRSSTVALQSTGIVPDTIAMARKLAVSPLPGESGMAIAYFPTCPVRHPNAVATLIAAPRDAIPGVELLPGGQLALALPRPSSDR